MVVLSGHPAFLVGGHTRKTGPGSLIVAGPDVPYGWSDRPAAASTHLVWVWSQPPALGGNLDAKTCWLREADVEAAAGMQELHRRTRREIQQPDGHSHSALAAIKVLVDAALARCAHGRAPSEARDTQRLQLAEQWMRRHLDIRAPAGALADYLGLSAMGLQRLFRATAGISPGRAFLMLKMREARHRLRQPDMSVKAVALSLGYRHAGDFTRAYAKFYGHPPSDGR